MAALNDMLVHLRRRSNLSQQELAEKLGLTRSAIGMYETGKREPSLETLGLFADFYKVDMNTLMGRPTENALFSLENIAPLPHIVAKPRLGAIACGKPILAQQNIEGYDQVPDYIKCDFTLLCKGDSMINARIRDGDIVCIRQTPEVENGQIAAVLIQGDFDAEATLKRVRFSDNGVTLWPENPAYEPLVFSGPAAEKVRIIGVATHFISRIV